MNRRIVARLDVKMQSLIKGIQMEGWRKVGDPIERAVSYYEQGIDEIIYIDAVASLYERNNLTEIVRQVAGSVFIPITVGGGIRNLQAVHDLLAVGADKVAINTAATQRPELLHEVSDTYGSQATVLSVEAKSINGGRWEAMTDNGRNHTGLDVVEWVQQAQDLGAGEILVTSIDRDGTKKGYDLELIKQVSAAVSIPVIASGGCGVNEHAKQVFEEADVSAIAIARSLHDDTMNLKDLSLFLINNQICVRENQQ